LAFLSPEAATSLGFIEPRIPTRADKPPVGPNWIHEIKHDGYPISLGGVMAACGSSRGAAMAGPASPAQLPYPSIGLVRPTLRENPFCRFE
jgi:hypothetical protein